jgi:putative peptidoglycan lipid II flippase
VTPSAVGLWVLAEPIVRLVYEHGAFDGEDTRLAASALRGYGVGLVFYALTKVQVPACYALGVTRLPLAGSCLAMACYATWALLTYRSLGVFGLAVGTSVAALVNATVLAAGLATRLPGGGAVLRGLAASALLAAVMGLLCRFLTPALEALWGRDGALAQGATVTLSVLAGFAFLLGAGRLLGLPEAAEVARAIGIGRTRPPSAPPPC